MRINPKGNGKCGIGLRTSGLAPEQFIAVFYTALERALSVGMDVSACLLQCMELDRKNAE